MSDLNPACNSDPFPDWPFGVNSDRRLIARDEWVRVPLDVAECPTCHFMLEATPMQVVREHGVGEIRSIDLRCLTWHDNDDAQCWGQHIMEAHRCDRVVRRVNDWMRETYQVPSEDHTVTDAVKDALTAREQ
jgi:hypothetical protein